jgi:hypothetical protein
MLGNVGYCKILLDIVGYCWIMLDDVGCCKILLDIVGYCRILLNTVGYCWKEDAALYSPAPPYSKEVRAGVFCEDLFTTR